MTESIFGGQPIAFAYVFGSHAAGTATERSDVDVAVYCVRFRTTLAARFSIMDGSERQAAVPHADVIVLNEVPLGLAGRAHWCTARRWQGRGTKV